ncbi:MAG: hypothetical protein KDD64_13745, partial [Bdellovibrionales bacterium]|nr:hypothetical protein [Bdellovibrionales bacterium]
DLPKANQELRESLEKHDSESLHSMLSELDPETSKRLHIQDRNRVIRAIEIATEGTHKLSEIHEKDRGVAWLHGAVVLILCWSRRELYRRIDSRARDMVQNGAMREVESLLKRFGEESALSSAIGFQEIAKALQQGGDPTEEIAQSTRRYAKRQLTYFRNEPKKRGWREAKLSAYPCRLLDSEPTQPSRHSKEKSFTAVQISVEDLCRELQNVDVPSHAVLFVYLDAEYLLAEASA